MSPVVVACAVAGSAWVALGWPRVTGVRAARRVIGHGPVVGMERSGPSRGGRGRGREVLHRFRAPLARGRADRAAEAALPLWLDAAAGSLRSGAALPEALCEAAEAVRATPLGPAVWELRRHLRSGRPLEAALAAFGGSGPSQCGVVARSLAVVARTGGAPASLLGRVATTVRDRVELAGELRALSTQARWSAWVMAGCPVAFAAFAGLADQRVLAFVLTTPIGWACVVCGLVLDAAGFGWMTWLLRAAER